MKLDRNTNPRGRGKYALVNLRALNAEGVPPEYLQWFDNLVAAGLVTLGNESPDSQFFVLKHKDAFAPEALRGYQKAVAEVAQHFLEVGDTEAGENLREYVAEIGNEIVTCLKVSRKIPD